MAKGPELVHERWIDTHFLYGVPNMEI
jgi:hypothetical protein